MQNRHKRVNKIVEIIAVCLLFLSCQNNTGTQHTDAVTNDTSLQTFDAAIIKRTAAAQPDSLLTEIQKIFRLKKGEQYSDAGKSYRCTTAIKALLLKLL